MPLVRFVVPSIGSVVTKCSCGVLPYSLMPDSSLMSVNDMPFSFSVFVMAFSAVRSTCFMGSPPAPVPRFGWGCFSVFSCGVICFCMLFLIKASLKWCFQMGYVSETGLIV